jgi:hypothetical protein
MDVTLSSMMLVEHFLNGLLQGHSQNKISTRFNDNFRLI